jgi:DNA-binding HxlR family transcriptional regulator
VAVSVGASRPIASSSAMSSSVSTDAATPTRPTQPVLGGVPQSPTARPDFEPVGRVGLVSRLLAGVSQKMLTQTLRSLERDGLVARTVTPTVPVTVSYELTPLGLSLYDMRRGVRQWAQDHASTPARDRRQRRWPRAWKWPPEFRSGAISTGECCCLAMSLSILRPARSFSCCLQLFPAIRAAP